VAAALALVVVLGACGSAAAAGPPLVPASWASLVFASSARINAEVVPNGLLTSYHFEYLTFSAYSANLTAGKEGFSGATKVPVLDASIGATGTVAVNQSLSGLQVATAYRYRVVAKNSGGTTPGPDRLFVTYGAASSALPDGRAWEIVSPLDKNGGEVAAPGALGGGGVLQAAASGGVATYGSATSFGGGAGAPPGSQYVSSRGAGGWGTVNGSPSLYSGSYGAGDEGVPFQLFSPDLERGLLLNGNSCRDGSSGCAVPNPPPPGSDAPTSYQDYFLRDAAGNLVALIGTSDVLFSQVSPADFEVHLAGATPDLTNVVLSTCSALTAEATEVPLGAACDPQRPNLYRWSSSSGSLQLVNLLPGDTVGTPGVALPAQAGTVSADGSRVYWTDLNGDDLYLRAGSQTKQVDTAAGGGGGFEAASSDGLFAFFTKGGHLWRYDAAADSADDLTPTGGVSGVLGASANGTRVYYQDAGGLRLWHNGIVSTVAPGVDAAATSNFPPVTGTARISADGTTLVFLSKAPLTGFDNVGLSSGVPESEVFRYDAGTQALSCVSCNPANGRPLGPSSIPGAIANGSVAGAADLYKPRVLSASGRRIFFDSRDALVLTDTNNASDVYEWEAEGEGSCTTAGGCLALVSSGRAAGGDRFVDASASGGDAYFLTPRSLVGADPGSVDLYDARVGGGFPEPVAAIPCLGDACQVLPPEPVDPTLTTLLSGPGNPSPRYDRYKGPREKKTHKKGKKKGKKKNGKGGRRAQGGSNR
jgi:hypothetical protein